jgi:hypothetical protein
MFMRLGRIPASHPQVANLYENGDQGQQEGMTSRISRLLLFFYTAVRGKFGRSGQSC